MILVTGVTGHVGRRVAALLAGRGLPLRLGARDPSRAPRIAGAEVVRVDYGDPASLATAFAGVERALVVSARAPPGDRALLHRNVFEAAADAGVAYVAYLSLQGAGPGSQDPMAVDHYLGERYLAACGVRWAALRDGFIADLLPSLFDADGVLRAPAGDGRAAFVAREDVAQVAAAVLERPPAASGAFDVTGPEALSLAEAARVLSVLAGRELRYEPESIEAALARLGARGAPEWEVEARIGSYQAIAAGELAGTSDAVLRLTGREPLSFEAVFAAEPEALAPLEAPGPGGFPSAYV